MAQNPLSTAFSLGLPQMLPRRAAGLVRLDLLPFAPLPRGDGAARCWASRRFILGCPRNSTGRRAFIGDVDSPSNSAAAGSWEHPIPQLATAASPGPEAAPTRGGKGSDQDSIYSAHHQAAESTMVLHANHQYRIGPQGSAYPPSRRRRRLPLTDGLDSDKKGVVQKLAKPKHKPEPPTAQCHFRYGRAAKQVYEGDEEITQIEWETLNASLRKTRMLEHRDAERQALATARSLQNSRTSLPKIPCPERRLTTSFTTAVCRRRTRACGAKGRMMDGSTSGSRRTRSILRRGRSPRVAA